MAVRFPTDPRASLKTVDNELGQKKQAPGTTLRIKKLKPVLRRFYGPRIGSVGASCFVDDFVSCWGKRVAPVAA